MASDPFSTLQSTSSHTKEDADAMVNVSIEPKEKTIIDSSSVLSVHEPRIVRIERDYSDGENCKFEPIYPMELDGRIDAQKFMKTINCINDMLEEAQAPFRNAVDHILECLTIYTYPLAFKSHYEKSLDRIEQYITMENKETYNPKKVNIVSPRETAFMYIRMELL